VNDVRVVRNLAVTVNGQPILVNERFTLKPDQMLYGQADHVIKVVPFRDL